MATTTKNVDWCLLALEEDSADLAAPEEMTRADVLEAMNEIYQNDIAEKMGLIKSASIVITSGVGSLPSDWVKAHRIYDGDAPDDNPLEQIFDIDERVESTADTTQYMLPDDDNIWVFGITPTTGIKAYYIYAPAALTESPSTTPVLKAKFHRKIFPAYIRQVYAMNNGMKAKEFEMGRLVESILNDIENEYTTGKRDAEQDTIKGEW
jgi:hypothetical protein